MHLISFSNGLHYISLIFTNLKHIFFLELRLLITFYAAHSAYNTPTCPNTAFDIPHLTFFITYIVTDILQNFYTIFHCLLSKSYNSLIHLFIQLLNSSISSFKIRLIIVFHPVHTISLS